VGSIGIFVIIIIIIICIMHGKGSLCYQSVFTHAEQTSARHARVCIIHILWRANLQNVSAAE